MSQALELRPATALRSELRLVADARRGDDRAFEELYSRYRQRIFAFILSRVRDHGRAEDIAQEVFISALRQLRTTDQEIILQPWLYTIAKNACIDEFRRGARGTNVPVGSDDDLSVGQGPMLSLVPTPDDAIESKQRLNDLRGAFGGLSDTHRRLLVMREFEGRSYDEIGEKLEMNQQMVESGLFRARRKLGAEYDELASGRRCEEIVEAITTGTFETVKGLGLKQRRRATRHLSHCQSCRHHAMMASVDQALLKPRSIADKLAALLPFGIWRKLWPHARAGAGGTATGGGKAAGTLGAAAQVAAPAAAGSSIGIGTAAVAAAVVVIAGAGGAVALTQVHSSQVAAPAHVSHAPAGAAAHSGTAARSSRSASAADHRSHASLAVVAKSVGSAGQKASKLHAAKLLGTTRSGGGANRGSGGSAGGGHGGSSTGGGGSTSGGSGSTGAGDQQGGSDNGNGTVGKTVTETGNTVGKTVSETGNTVGKTVSETGNTVGGTVSQAGNTVGGTVSQAGNTVGGTVSSTGNTVGGIVNTVAPGTGNTVSGVANTVGGTISQTGNTVGGTVSQAGNTVGGTISQTGNTVGSTVGGVTGIVGGLLGGS